MYAATVVFFECLTGMRPFRAPNMAALARQHQSAPPPVEEVPAPLQGLVERGLAKDPAERPPSAEAFLTELEAVATEAYGPDWEERGRRRLAALAGLLVLLFPSALEEPAETQTSLAETHFPEPTRLLSKLPAKIALGAVGVGVLVAAVVVILTSGSAEPVLQAGTSSVTPTTTEALTPEPEETVPEETPEESTEPTLDPTTPDPTPTDTATAAPPVVQPTATAKPTKTATPTPVKTPRKTRKPTPSRTPTSTPTPTPEPEMSGEVNDRTPTTRPTTPAPTPTPVPVTPTPPRTTATTPSEEPGGDDESPTVTPDETPRREAAGALLALGLVTTGGLPVTLAVRRRMAGRHRRKR
ncbi:serine/threonine protein kinase [[Actinomadura] parvosata subsp. kistnae]|uniref:hypothetical protein n=1 Tax=[Actinomadura] parvosata TaxID=1955412 RepID=UPI000D2EF27D|nr:serine/threonine protein kinase [Actinomadura parvosata subsp. kistnae]